MIHINEHLEIFSTGSLLGTLMQFASHVADTGQERQLMFTSNIRTSSDFGFCSSL